MKIYKRVSAVCSGCGKEKRRDVDGSERVVRWRCACGAELEGETGSDWYVTTIAAGRRYREKIGPDRDKALKVARKRETERFEGKFFPDKRRPCPVTLAAYAETFLAWAKTAKRSWARDAQSLGFLKAHFGSTPLDRITTVQVETYKRLRLAGTIQGKRGAAREPTVNRELRCLSKLLARACEDGTIQENPIGRGKLRLFPERAGREKYLEPVQIRALLDACSDRIRPLIHFLVLTGCRLKEARLLTWQEVDLTGGVVNVPASRSKSKHPRKIPMSSATRNLLLEMRGGSSDPAAFVFADAQGKALRSIRTAWLGAVARAGLGDLRIHDLRHCAASAMASRGVPLAVISKVLGHRTLAMSERYAHLLPNAVASGVEEVARFLTEQEPVADGTGEAAPMAPVIPLAGVAG